MLQLNHYKINFYDFLSELVRCIYIMPLNLPARGPLHVIENDGQRYVPFRRQGRFSVG